ncbi:MAG: hypothetical protein AAB425_05115 [Bdellovibrionota bacterium]
MSTVTLMLLNGMSGSVFADPGDVIREVHVTADIPGNVSPEQALDGLVRFRQIFEIYVPKIPKLVANPDLYADKVLGDEKTEPNRVGIHVHGPIRVAMFSKKVDEQMDVVASAEDIACELDPDYPAGKLIFLDLRGSTESVRRRVREIQVQVCLEDYEKKDHTMGRRAVADAGLIEGELRIDPQYSKINESVGAEAFEAVFANQVAPMIKAYQKLLEKTEAE